MTDKIEIRFTAEQVMFSWSHWILDPWLQKHKSYLLYIKSAYSVEVWFVSYQADTPL